MEKEIITITTDEGPTINAKCGACKYTVNLIDWDSLATAIHKSVDGLLELMGLITVV